MRARIASGIAVGVACVLLAACGASATQQVRSKMQQFAVAVAHHDAKTICAAVFAPSLVQRFVAAGLTCERGLLIFFSGLRHPTLAVGRITVHGSRASAMTLSGANGQTASLRPVELVKTSDGWRIVALGSPARSPRRTGTTSNGKTTTGSKTTTKRAPAATTKRKPTTTKRKPTTTTKRKPSTTTSGRP